MAAVDLVGISGGSRPARHDRRWRRTARDRVAGLGDHHGDRRAPLLADGLAGGVVPRVASGRLRGVEGSAVRSPRGTVGMAVVLSRVQYRQRRTHPRDGSLRRNSAMTTASAGRQADVRDDDVRHAPLAMTAATFRTLGHRLVDQVAELLESVPLRPVTRDESPSAVREALGLTDPLPEQGTDAGVLLEQTAARLFDHSLFNAHPRFFGYITAPPAPIGVLGELLAAALNPNVGAWNLSPAATEIESQTVRWIAEFLGYPVDCGGLLVSGGNMANIVCLLAARAASARWNLREQGVRGGSGQR